MPICPRPLLDMSRSVLRAAFSSIIQKKVYTLDFDRGSKESDSPKHMQLLHQKFERALSERAVMISSPDCVKSLQLKYIDLLQQVSSADPYLFCQRNKLGGLLTPVVEELASVLKEKELVADHLGDILQLWRKNTVALIDEVDLVLHPLKSELNFPIGEKFQLHRWNQRWGCPFIY